MPKYLVTVQEITSGAEPAPSLSFETVNHDDLFRIVEIVRSKELLDLDKSAAMAIGLKLFAEIVLEKRNETPFSGIYDPIRTFIQELKKISKSS